MALDESGATLRSTLELVELKTPSAEPGLGQSHFTFDTARLNVPLRSRNNGTRSLGGPGVDFGSDGAGRTSRENGDISPGVSDVSASSDTSPSQVPGDYFGLGMNSLRQ